MRIVLSLLVCAAMLATSVPEAGAEKKRVVILKFSGPKASRFHAAVVKLVRRKHHVIGHKKYQRAAKRLRASRIGRTNIAKVASQLRADGVVQCEVRRRQRRYKLDFRITSGATGEFVNSFTFTARRWRLSRRERRHLRSQLLRAFADLRSKEAHLDDIDRVAAKEPAPDDYEYEEEEEEEEALEEEAGGEEAVEEEPREASGRGSDEVLFEDDEVEEEPAHHLEAERPRPAHRSAPAHVTATRQPEAGLTVADLAAGVSVTSRQLSFVIRPGLNNAPRGYDGAPVAGAFADAELYPVAAASGGDSVAANVGLSLLVDRVLRIKSQFAYMDASNRSVVLDLPTTQMRYAAGVVFRQRLGKGATSPAIKLSARYNRLNFTIDRTQASGVSIDTPNMDYSYIDPGLGLHLPFSRSLALFAEGRYLLVTNLGDMQRREQYGGASVTAYEAEGGLQHLLSEGLLVRVGVRYIAFNLTFDGTGMLVNARDFNSSTTDDVRGASDRYLGGYAVLGYLF